jgi:hypothetical protein
MEDKIVHTDLKTAGKPHRIFVGPDERENLDMPRPLKRAKLTADSEPVASFERKRRNE